MKFTPEIDMVTAEIVRLSPWLPSLVFCLHTPPPQRYVVFVNPLCFCGQMCVSNKGHDALATQSGSSFQGMQDDSEEHGN